MKPAINLSKCDVFSCGLVLINATNLLGDDGMAGKKLNKRNSEAEIISLCD